VCFSRFADVCRYNEGRLTARELDKQGRQAGAAGWNPKDPVQLEKALAAQRSILRMMRQNRESVQMRRAPENTGIVFLPAKMQSALGMAHARVKLVSGCQHVPLIDLMVHDEVRQYFAYLVALEMASSNNLFAPTRYARGSQGSEVAALRSELLEVFKGCDYDQQTGVLVFTQLHQPDAAAQRYVIQHARALEYEHTGTLQHAPYAARAMLPFKKPRFEQDPRQQMLQIAQAERMTGGGAARTLRLRFPL
jgi:hypothetical protein